MTNSGNELGPIAIVGTGIPGVSAIINKLADIAFNAKHNAPPVNLIVFDAKGPRPKEDSPYPCGDQLPRALHPFSTQKPAPGFPTFGEYVDESLEYAPDLKAALVTPTYAQIHGYLKYVLELAVGAAADRVRIDATATEIVEIRESAPGGPAVIVLIDGAEIQVSSVVRAKPPKYMGGPAARASAASDAPGVEPSARKKLRVTLDLLREAADLAIGQTGIMQDKDRKSHLLMVIGTRRIAVIALDLPESELGPHASLVAGGLGRIGATELWVVTPQGVGEALHSQLAGQPVRLISFADFLSLLEKLAIVGPTFQQ